MSDDGSEHTYKLIGSKGDGERIDRVVIEGDSSNPKVFVDVGGTVELTAEDAKRVSSEFGVVLRKQKDDGTDDNTSEVAPPDLAPTTREEQHVAQQPSMRPASPSEPQGSHPAQKTK